MNKLEVSRDRQNLVVGGKSLYIFKNEGRESKIPKSASLPIPVRELKVLANNTGYLVHQAESNSLLVYNNQLDLMKEFAAEGKSAKFDCKRM